MEMLRVLTFGLVAFLAAQIPLAAQASTITFDLTLTDSIYGPTSGSGTLNVDAPISNPLDIFTSNGGGLNALSININNEDFTLQQALLPATATFSAGDLTNISYMGMMDGFKLNLDTTGLFYLYTDANNWTLTSVGRISAVEAPSVTPLPASSVLFATGLVGLGLLMTRRRKTQARPALA